MKIDYCLILSAGFGTRMGAIGRKLPKVLWPIFEKSLLQIQIDYALFLGCKKIFVNTHFAHEKVVDHLVKTDYLKHVILLHEETILGAGGAIHNLAQIPEVNYKGNLLTLNGDQFFFMSKKELMSELKSFGDHTNILFGLKVAPATGYGQVIIENHLMKEIVAEDRRSPYYTYSGVGVTKLELLKHEKGISRFFDAVADYKSKKVKMVTGLGLEYWDFGTIKRYFDSMFSLVDHIKNKERSRFIDFLLGIEAIDTKKISDGSYGTNLGRNVIHLCDDDSNNLEIHDNAIILDSKNLDKKVTDGIFYQGIVEQV